MAYIALAYIVYIGLYSYWAYVIMAYIALAYIVYMGLYSYWAYVIMAYFILFLLFIALV